MMILFAARSVSNGGGGSCEFLFGCDPASRSSTASVVLVTMSLGGPHVGCVSVGSVFFAFSQYLTGVEE
jgi:hypothetical protein